MVPEPSDVRVGEGVFSLTRRTEIRLSDGDSSLARAAGFSASWPESRWAGRLRSSGAADRNRAICVALGDLPAEAYVLSVRSDRIDLTGLAGGRILRFSDAPTDVAGVRPGGERPGRSICPWSKSAMSPASVTGRCCSTRDGTFSVPRRSSRLST
ncbi:MAG: hypothetical protein ACLTTP_11370 [Alistipes ihumii]